MGLENSWGSKLYRVKQLVWVKKIKDQHFEGHSILAGTHFWGSKIGGGPKKFKFNNCLGLRIVEGHYILRVIQFQGSFNFGGHSIWGLKSLGDPKKIGLNNWWGKKN